MLLTVIISGVSGGMTSYIIDKLLYLIQKYKINKLIKKDIQNTMLWLEMFKNKDNKIDLKAYMILESNFINEVLNYNLDFKILNFYQIKQSLNLSINEASQQNMYRIINNLIFRGNEILTGKIKGKK